MDENKLEDKKVVFGELDKAKFIVVEASKAEMRSWVVKREWTYGIIGAIIGFVIVFLGFQSLRGIRNYQEEAIGKVKIEIDKQMENALENVSQLADQRINLKYEETAIDSIICRLIEKDASALIELQIRKELEPIITQIKNDQQKYTQLIALNTLAIYADNGDKQSYINLRKYRQSTNDEYARFAKMVSERIQTKYYEAISVQFMGYTNQDSVEKYLYSDTSHYRLCAIGQIQIDSLFSFTPSLIALIEKETELDVCGVLFRTLNMLLGTNIDLLAEDAVQKFTDAYKKLK